MSFPATDYRSLNKDHRQTAKTIDISPYRTLVPGYWKGAPCPKWYLYITSWRCRQSWRGARSCSAGRRCWTHRRRRAGSPGPVMTMRLFILSAIICVMLPHQSRICGKPQPVCSAARWNLNTIHCKSIQYWTVLAWLSYIGVINHEAESNLG